MFILIIVSVLNNIYYIIWITSDPFVLQWLCFLFFFKSKLVYGIKHEIYYKKVKTHELSSINPVNEY